MPAEPPNDFKALKDLLLNLLTKSENCWGGRTTFNGNRLKKSATDAYEKLHEYREGLQTGSFSSAVKESTSKISIGDDSALYLPPLDDDSVWVPLLSVKVSRDEQKAQFRVDLYKFDSELEDFRYVGFRFEAPTEGDATHSYFHVQPSEREAVRFVEARIQGPHPGNRPPGSYNSP